MAEQPRTFKKSMSEELYARVAEKAGVPALQLVGADRETLTFFGGSPRVATPFEWPRKDGRPLGFLGQLELSELETGEAAPWLPIEGRLLFFYDMEDYPWGFDPKDKGGWAVIHDRGGQPTTVVGFPPDLKTDYRLEDVKFLEGRKYVSIPNLERVTLEEVGITEEEEDEYYELVEDAFGENPMHQVGGFPAPIQGDYMEVECQLVSAGVYCGGPAGYQSQEAAEIRNQPNDWKLLLQYDSDDDIGVMWGDVGRLYFWIRERDARAGDFQNVWVVQQCG